MLRKDRQRDLRFAHRLHQDHPDFYVLFGVEPTAAGRDSTGILTSANASSNQAWTRPRISLSVVENLIIIVAHPVRDGVG